MFIGDIGLLFYTYWQKTSTQDFYNSVDRMLAHDSLDKF